MGKLARGAQAVIVPVSVQAIALAHLNPKESLNPNPTCAQPDALAHDTDRHAAAACQVAAHHLAS